MHFFAIFMDLMCFYEFYFREKGQIREIRENISTRKLVHLKYASSAWYPNLGKGLKKKLQIAQNKCVRYCLYLGNREGIRYRHFKEMNWLPISERVDQFIAVGAFKFSKGLARLSTSIYGGCFQK